LAGTSLALSSEKRRDKPGQTAFIVKRGLLIAALDPLWMSLGFGAYRLIAFQELYAIGMSMVCMAFLRKLSSRALITIAFAIQISGELSKNLNPQTQPLSSLWHFLFVGGPVFRPVFCFYPLIPWLSIMIFGFVLGRWLVETRDRP